MGILDSFLHPGDPYKKAEQAEQEGWKQAQGYERPFWQQGQDQYGRLNEAAGNLLDPAALEAKWASGYEESPYAKQELALNQAGGLDAASSMGLNGSSAALNNIQTGAGNIVRGDREQYMTDLMNKYLAGIGLSSGIYGAGANAGNVLASGAMSHGANQAQLQYGRNAAPGELFGKLAGMGVGIGAGAFGEPGGWAGAAEAARNMFGGGSVNQNYNSGVPGY